MGNLQRQTWAKEIRAMIERVNVDLNRDWLYCLAALQLPTKGPKLKWFTAATFSFLLVIHLIVLPAHILGPDIGLRSFQYISLSIAIFAVLFAALESVLINVWVRLIHQKTHCRTAPAAGGIVIGIVSPLLCCTPLLPSVLSFIAILFPSAVSGMGVTIQYGPRPRFMQNQPRK